MDEHHFQELMEWMLKKGRDDADARTTALSLARRLVTAVERDNQRLIERVVPMLLADFPEIVWPLMSGVRFISGIGPFPTTCAFEATGNLLFENLG